MQKSTYEWLNALTKNGVLWQHAGDLNQPHALLSSGQHSNRFCNSDLLTQNPALLDVAGFDLVEKLQMSGINLETVDRVVGPAMGAITLSHTIALQIIKKTGKQCLTAYAEKDMDPVTKEKIMTFKRVVPKAGEQVLVVEDVFTTGGSISLVVQAVLHLGAKVLPYLPVLVNRSLLSEIGGREIVSLVNLPMSSWLANDCPLCKEGSEALKPKEADNWSKLTALK